MKRGAKFDSNTRKVCIHRMGFHHTCLLVKQITVEIISGLGLKKYSSLAAELLLLSQGPFTIQ